MSRHLIFNYACCQGVVNNNMLTQRSSCIGRLQVEKRVAKSICSSIICYIFVVCDVNQYMSRSSNLSLYSLNSNFSTSCIGKAQPKNAHIRKSQHETILADLNRYTTAMRLVIILMDDAIKHMCIWPLA